MRNLKKISGEATKALQNGFFVMLRNTKIYKYSCKLRAVTLLNN